ncbi:MAG: amidohydrolase family protein, partial [Acidobacteriota bacterium]|nr:amidohydrolase family protein [Acidobacteriota bacterium]
MTSSQPKRFLLAPLAIGALTAFAACGAEPPPLPGVTAFTGATLWDGTGGAAVENAVLVVDHGRISAVGPAGEVEVPPGAAVEDLAGRTVVPGFINAHAHASDVMGLETGHYSRENLIRQLGLYARYGVTSVASLGGDGPEAARLRDEQDDSLDRARIWIAGEVISSGTPEEAAE